MSHKDANVVIMIDVVVETTDAVITTEIIVEGITEVVITDEVTQEAKEMTNKVNLKIDTV